MQISHFPRILLGFQISGGSKIFKRILRRSIFWDANCLATITTVGESLRIGGRFSSLIGGFFSKEDLATMEILALQGSILT